MRVALAVSFLLVIGCTATGPLVAQRSPTPSNAPSSMPTTSPVTLASGGVIEYPIPNPSPIGSGCAGCGKASLSGITAARDGNIWYFDVGQTLVGRVTPAGVITQYPVPAAGSGSRSIIGAPDGNIWMAGRVQAPTTDTDLIIKVSPAGVVTRFSVGVGVGPESITWGPDGNIWFTEFWSGQIGRMTPVGETTKFPGGSQLRGIVTGPDHNLWFVQSDFNRAAIGRMTTSGVVTLFPLGGSADQQLQPADIIAGPDGNLWFNETHKLGRISVAGVITRFQISAKGHPTGLAAGPDGNVWFTNAFENTVGRISPEGVIKQFPLPRRNSQPGGITAGPDGRMWFLEDGRSKVAKIGMTVPETKFSSRVLNFGTFDTTGTRNVTVTNTGDGPLRMNSATVVGLDQELFSVQRDTCSGKVLATQAQCSVEVSKLFTGGGPLQAQLQLVDNASGSPQLISLIARVPDCRLPLYAESPLHGQFLSVATGQIADDPKVAFVIDGMLWRSQATPVLTGQTWASYDRPAARWVPANVDATSPDGSRYAYVDYRNPPNFQLHVVDVATGRDRLLSLDKGFWSLIGFTNAGIYLHQSYEGVGPGLTLVNPDSGAIRTIFSDSPVAFVSGDVAWTYAWNDADKLPHPPGMGGGHNQVGSRDLNTSNTTPWLYRAGTDLYVMGVTDRSIVVRGNDPDASYVWVVTGPGHAQPVTAPGTGDAESFAGRPVADGNGWWLGSQDGLYLWTPRTGAFLVSDVKATPAGTCA